MVLLTLMLVIIITNGHSMEQHELSKCPPNPMVLLTRIGEKHSGKCWTHRSDQQPLFTNPTDNIQRFTETGKSMFFVILYQVLQLSQALHFVNFHSAQCPRVKTNCTRQRTHLHLVRQFLVFIVDPDNHICFNLNLCIVEYSGE